ncbi:MAG: hypothetical protein IJL25_04530 [Clostridia bacterium]|nr:hypothetical protein [Clostridia bacterium]
MHFSRTFKNLTALILLTALAVGAFRFAPVDAAMRGHTHMWLRTGGVAPTCLAAGQMQYTCAVCGEKYTEAIPSFGGHVFTESVQKAPTCAEEGLLAHTCSRCGEIRTETLPVIDAHMLGETVLQTLTCGQEGLIRYTCSVCGKTFDETVPPTGAHVLREKEISLPTCTEEGYVRSECTECGAVKTVPVMQNAPHTWTDTVPVQPTCLTAGEVLSTCAVCGTTRNGLLPNTNVHVWQLSSETAPTCVTPGVKRYYCVGCVIERSEETPATGVHTWDEGEITTAPTISGIGIRTRRCTGCGIAHTEAVPALNDAKYADAISRLPTYIPPAPAVTAPHDTFTFVMYGNGDGVGMPQQGAIEMAKVGLPYDYILSYYYTGTTIVQDASVPAQCYYRGSYVNTEELLARIIYSEIGDSGLEAQKAQGVCAYTMLKYYNFYVTDNTYFHVGSAASSYAACPDSAKIAAAQVLGEYMIMAGDASREPALAEYHDMCAGHTLNAIDAWGGGDFPLGVPSPFEACHPDFITYYTCSSAEMRSLILDWDPTCQLSADPAEWIEILSHDGSLDENRGYVTSMRIGNKTLNGIGRFNTRILDLKTSCFTVVYTP